jgi:hypothetical protein
MVFEPLLDVIDRFPNLRKHKSFQFWCSKVRNLLTLIRIGVHTCTNHTVPYGTALFGRRCPRHFVPGYDRVVPPGQFAQALVLETRDRSNVPQARPVGTTPIVAWHEVPGTASLERTVP